jgi:hypothetical protein
MIPIQYILCCCHRTVAEVGDGGNSSHVVDLTKDRDRMVSPTRYYTSN